ncbi:MAG TPA: hypothetical protein VMD53_06585 [Rhizomicrobium sp.]|nr:hypothetical protein [Rhizomicrobium sp.]
MSTFTPITLDSSSLLNYYSAQLQSIAANATQSASSNSQSSSSSSSGSGTSTSSSNSSFGSSSSASSETPPWDVAQTLSTQAQNAQVLSTTNFIQQSTTPLVGSSSTSKATQEDNQNLFTLYQAVSKLSTLANIASQAGVTSGELAGYNAQFQTGLQQVESFISDTTFNNLTLQAQTPSASVTSTVGVPLESFQDNGGTIVSDAQYSDPLSGVSISDSFNIAVTKGGTTTNVPIDLSQVQGPLTISNIVNYANQQLKADGFSSTLSVNMTSGSINDVEKATYGISITPAPGETLSLSAADAMPDLIVAGTGGSTTGSASTASGQAATSADNQGTITALTNLSSSSPTTLFNATEAPTTGTTTAVQTVVDSQGNVYEVGNATGNMGNQLNQGSQDVYLTKYDSAGNLQWSELLGSAGSASAFSLALNPSTGGVVVSGSTTADLTSTAVTNGNTDSFVASYDQNGNQLWTQQIPTLSANQANAVTVDSSGNVYIGGSVGDSGTIGSGQTSTGGTNAYIAELDSSGNIVSENQFGASGDDQVSAMATTSDGDVVVASVQNGQAVLSKYASGEITGSPVWTMNLGNLNGGSISGLTVSGDNVYVSGTTSNGALTAGGQATVANASNGSTDAFVFAATDNGTTATANTVSYVSAPGGSTTGGNVTVGPDGTIYLAGTTTGTFAGQTRTLANTNNTFVAALSSSGAIDWTQQFGGTDGQSTGASVAVDPTGSSVLTALGLPSGAVNVNQSVDLTSDTTLRAGDSFQLQTEGTGGRTSTISITQGETLQDLADSINAELLTAGKATVTYSSTGSQGLEVTASAGQTINVIAGPADTNALGRLGITPGVITASAKKGASSSTATGTSFGVNLASSSSSSGSSSMAKPVVGLGLDTQIDLLSSGDANVAKVSLQNVMTAITNAYQKINTPASSSSTTPTAPASKQTPAPSILAQQQAGYSLALATLASMNSLSTTSSSTTNSIGISSSALLSALTV